VSVTTPELVGREAELAELASFLDGDLPSAVVLEGDAGIGKTTIWREGIRLAEERGYRVLATSGAPGEMQMAFAGLADLLEPVLDDVLPALPGPQREALEVTLLLEETSNAQSGRAVPAALLSSLRALADEERVVIAVDDVHWLDAATVAALSFAVRRLRDQTVGLLFALRTSEGAVLPLDFARTSFERRAQRLPVGPLSVGALRLLLQARTDLRLSRPVLLRVHETSAGNPFFALELVRALARLDVPLDAGRPLPVPDDLARLLAESISALPPEAREATLVCALLARPTLDVVSLATGKPAEQALGPTFDAGIIELSNGTVRFSHPLMRSAVHAQASSVELLAWHRRLADVVPDLEQRASHLALCSAEPSEDVARELERAGGRACRRGGQATGASLLEHARRLTPEHLGDRRARRSICATDALLECGERRRAVELLEQLQNELPHGPLRADVLLRVAWADTTNLDESMRLAQEALSESAGDEHREAQALFVLANIEHVRGGRRAAVDYALRALSIAETLGHETLLCRVLTGLGVYESFLGVGDPPARFRRALELEGATEAELSPWSLGGAYWAPGTMLSDWQTKNGELDAARALLDEQYRRASETGEDESRLLLCTHISELESLAGRLDRARHFAEEGLALAEESEARLGHALLLCSLGVVEAFSGSLDRARELVEDARDIADSTGDELGAVKMRQILCFIELSAGRPDAALREIGKQTDDPAVGHFPFDGDRVEALIATGRVDEARDELARVDRLAAVPGRRVLELVALRCRGLLTAATGDLDSSVATLEAAVSFSKELPVPLERGRTLLALGQARRRAKQKRAAREALEAARAEFADMGSVAWVTRAEEELARIGGRARSAGGLTASERRIAELVAEGQSNKEVAAALFISAKTVDVTLSRIYAKLGIHSRTELARQLAAGKV
jgi:DNA-binding CsgD family transcriptional regulator